MRSRIVLGICIGLLLAGSLSADTDFTGAVSELWSNPGNWSAGLPDDADKANFRNGVSAVLDYDAGVIKNVALEGGASTLRLVDGAKLTVWEWSILAYNGGEEGARHTLEVLGGVYNGGDVSRAGNNGRIYVGREGFGRLVIDYGGVVNLFTQEMQVGQGTNGDGVVELKGGTLNLTTNGDHPLRFATGTNAKGSMDIGGGVVKQRFSEGRLTRINGYIASGNITAYGGVGTVLVETVDNVLIVKGLHPLNPVPEDGGATTPGDLTLGWTVEAGTPVDVWFGTSADLSGAKLIVDKKAVTSVAVKVDPKQRYYWAVDTYAPGAQDPNWGPVFAFLVDNLPPVVRASADVTTWLVDGSREVAISAIVDDSDPTTTLWTMVSEPNEATTVIADPAQLDTTVTLTKTGTYVLQLEASDGEYSGSDTMTINVFADSCLAAQSLPGYEPIPGDINLDCRVDQLDLDILQAHWLECSALDCNDVQ